MMLGERIAAEALALGGVRFRLHGRSEETGLDCVGLVALAADRAGMPIARLPAYRLHGTGRSKAERALAQAGFVSVGVVRSGDVLLVESGPMQLHLMIHSDGGLIHAHAGLGRVVLMPSPSPWPILGHWRADHSGKGE